MCDCFSWCRILLASTITDKCDSLSICVWKRERLLRSCPQGNHTHSWPADTGRWEARLCQYYKALPASQLIANFLTKGNVTKVFFPPPPHPSHWNICNLHAHLHVITFQFIVFLSHDSPDYATLKIIQRQYIICKYINIHQSTCASNLIIDYQSIYQSNQISIAPISPA